jgi:radical SAM/Cys-rich protein
MMDKRVAEKCIELLGKSPSVQTLDITGGAPELNDNFRFMVTEGKRLGKEVIDRCNLTVFSEPGQEDLGSFLAENKVRVVASLPCYSEKNVDLQRGSGVFSRSIRGLLLLNQLGYGQPGSGLTLDLVYNPLGAFLPPEQTALEATYRRKLEADFGISFNNLFTLTNMPIKRFADQLHRRGELAQYMDLLVRNFNAAACGGVMCLDLVSVDHLGRLYDCDFNQQLATHMVGPGRTVFDLESLDDLVGSAIATDSHCFGCTAGMGSSCQGTTA